MIGAGRFPVDCWVWDGSCVSPDRCESATWLSAVPPSAATCVRREGTSSGTSRLRGSIPTILGRCSLLLAAGFRLDSFVEICTKSSRVCPTPATGRACVAAGVAGTTAGGAGTAGGGAGTTGPGRETAGCSRWGRCWVWRVAAALNDGAGGRWTGGRGLTWSLWRAGWNCEN